jgi:hypothetical protein
MQQRIQETRAALEAARARRAAREVTPETPPQIDQETLKPETPFETPERVDRTGLLDRLQSLTEATVGSFANIGSQLIPGQQDFLGEKELMKNITDASNELEAPTNPWDYLRWDLMRVAEGYRRTKMASKRLDLIPGKGINLPGNRTLNEIDFGVKGAGELLLDPINFVPFGLVAKVGVRGTAAGLKAARLGFVNEAVATGKDAASAAMESVRGMRHLMGNIPSPQSNLPNNRGTRLSVQRDDALTGDYIPNEVGSPKFVVRKDGNVVAEVEISPIDANGVAQVEMYPPKGVDNKLGRTLTQRELREAAKQVFEEFPDLKRIEGERVSGASGGAATVRVQGIDREQVMKGVHQPDNRFIRPVDAVEQVRDAEKKIETLPGWVKSLRDAEKGSITKYPLGALQWGFTRINPMTMLSAGSDVSKKIRLSTLAHQFNAVHAPSLTDFALVNLDNFAGYKGDLPHGLFSVKNEGVLARLGINKSIPGVFDVDERGLIENLSKVDGSFDEIVGDGFDSTAHQYRVFEAAFDPAGGYEFSKKFNGKLIWQNSEQEIDALIAAGTVHARFVNQAFAIKHIQDWYDEAGRMLDEFGVPRSEVYDGDSLMQYIARIARSQDDIDLPSNRKTTGAKQSISKKRTYSLENFDQGRKDGLQYENNFMLSSREFSDSIYQSIRDHQLKNQLKQHGHEIRKELLHPLRQNVNEAKARLDQINRAIALVNANSKGMRLKGSQVSSLNKLGGELGFDWGETKAVDVTQRHIAGLKHAKTQAVKIVAEAKRVRQFVGKQAAKDGAELFERLGFAQRSGNIWQRSEIPEAFQRAYPEFSQQLKNLQAMDVKLATQSTAKKVRRTKDGQVITTENLQRRAYERQRKRMAAAIKRDVEEAERIANRAKSVVDEAQRRSGALSGSDRRWLESNYPQLRKLIDSANEADTAVVRAERLKVVEEKLVKEQEQVKKMYDQHVEDMSKTAKGLKGDIWTVENGPIDPITGKHPIKVVKGVAYRDALEKGTLLVKRSEASQQRLPFLTGIFFTEDDIKQIERALLLPDGTGAKGAFQTTFLRTVPAAGDLARVLKAGFDFGAPFLQGIPVLARRPDIWAKATVRHMKVFATGNRLHRAYLQQNMDSVREMVQMGVPLGGAASDYFVAVQRGGVLPKVGEAIESGILKNSDRLAARATRRAGRSFESFGTRFEQSFESFGDYARVEMWKAMRDTAAKDGPEGLQELAGFIRNATGALNSGALGVGPTQQAVERGWMFFSPRYTRASLSLVADAFQGGLRGREARQTFAQMLAGGAAMYALVAGATGQPIKLDPRPKSDGGDGAEFMTININGNNVGIGSFWTGFIRLLGATGSTALDDPEVLLKPSTRDNPIVRWFRSRSAPMTGMSLDMMNGANFLGEPLDNIGDWAQHLGRQTLPFVVENAIFDEGSVYGRLSTNVPVEFFGGRTFPVSKIEQRNSEREKAAGERFDKRWEELNGLQKDELENDPNRPLGQLSLEVREEANKMNPSDPESAEGIIDAYFADKREIELDWRAEIKNGMNLYDTQKIDTVTLKERYIEPANNDRRLRIGDLSDDDSYAEVEQYFEQLEANNETFLPEEYAFSQYIDTIVSADFSDPVMGFNFRKRDAAERAFADAFGQEMLAYVRERFKAAREDYNFEFPAILDELYIGRERFTWYWRDVEQEVLNTQRNPDQIMYKYERWLESTPTTRKQMEETNADLKGFLSTMSKTRRLLRESNPELDAFMYRWGFADTLAHPDNQFEGAESFWRHAPGMSFPLPIQTFE